MTRERVPFRAVFACNGCGKDVELTADAQARATDIIMHWQKDCHSRCDECLKKRKPTAEDRRDGLKPKYQIRHADGSPCDSDAKYFVLRLDYHPGCDERHISACRAAVMTYAHQIQNHLPTLASDIWRTLEDRE
jgi:hypothetical protein